MSDELKVSQEVMDELMAMVPQRDPRKIAFTPEQDRVLLTAREHGVPWADLTVWWSDKYRKICRNTLMNRHKELVRSTRRDTQEP